MDEKMKAAIDAACKAAAEAVDGEEAMLICAFAGASGALSFEDNMKGECASCGKEIVWRPHADRIGMKVCVPCGIEVMKAIKAGAQ